MTTNLKKRYRNIFPLILLSVLTACSSIPDVPAHLAPDMREKQCVILVHGLWQSGWAMWSIENDLRHFSYQTVRVSYPSTSMHIPEIAESYLPPAIEECKQGGAEKIHFVTHSMGGIVVRQYLQNNRLPEGSKVVMLSPPNQGSELSEKFGESSWYYLVVGPAGVSLSGKEGGIIPSLKAVEESIGVIAAYRDLSLWPSTWLPKPNDGTVSVESMKLAEMDDFVMVKSGHVLMCFNKNTHKQIRYFLAQGEFYHSQDKSVPSDRDS